MKTQASKGIKWNKKECKWEAFFITPSNRTIHIGFYQSIIDAQIARVKFLKKKSIRHSMPLPHYTMLDIIIAEATYRDRKKHSGPIRKKGANNRK